MSWLSKRRASRRSPGARADGAELGDDAWLQRVVQFIDTFAPVKKAVGATIAWAAPETGRLVQELGRRALLDMLAASTLDSWFNVGLNGVGVLMPRYTLMTMRHCITRSTGGRIDLRVETAHWQRMRNEFTAGTLFLDVGAATGAMSIPYAVAADNDLRIVAFEPSRRARRYLEATVARNHVSNMTVLPYALSDQAGTFEFMELPEDDTGDTPFLPEGSRLRTANEPLYRDAAAYPVDVRTLDSLSQTLRFADAKNVVIKIDVEGFEDKVLLGSRNLLAGCKPYLSIDIHTFPGTQTMTDAACGEVLVPLGYQIERLGHVLLARAG